jgi:hypothetical protein
MINPNNVNQMRSTGLSDSRIISGMRSSGMNNTQTYDTMRLADLAKNGSDKLAELPEMPMPSPPSEPPMMPPPMRSQYNSPQSFYPQAQGSQGQPGGIPPSQVPPPPMQPFPNMAFPSPQQATGTTVEEIEEVVETIIDERWKEVTENIKKVIDWKNLMDQRFERMDQEIKDLKENFNELYKAIVGKIGDYDKNLLKVGSDLKAMEKVFSKVLPTFTENVNDLSRIAEDIKMFAVKREISREEKKKR